MPKNDVPEIIKAATDGDTTRVQSLLERGTPCDTRDMYDRTPLMVAGKHLAVLKLLLGRGANVNAIDNSGKTSLIFSIFVGNEQAVQLLLAHNADANIRDKSGKLPVTYAWEAANYKILEVLYNAQPSTDIALAALIGDLQRVKDIVQEGGNINKPSEFGETALTASIGRNHFTVAEYLIQSGADVNLMGRYCSPLVSAIFSRNIQLIENLTIHGADVNSITDYGTPLIVAVASGDPKIVELLLNYQADLNAVDAEGYTALSTAIDEEHQEIIALLQRRSATPGK